MITEAIETCPYCLGENSYPDYDVEKQGYIAKCQTCGKAIFLCDECLNADDNPEMWCDWHIENGYSCCHRGRFKDGATYDEIKSDIV